MNATLLLLPKAEADAQALSARDLRIVRKTLRHLCDYPRMAQTAGMTDAPDVRRAIAGVYLIYYRYNPLRNEIRVFTIRSARQKPIEAQELEG